MRYNEILAYALKEDEKTARSALASIKATIGNPIQQLYRNIQVTADKYSLEHPDMYKFDRIAGSAKGRWADEYLNRLKNDIRTLAENIPPKSARILKQALLERPATFKQAMESLIPALLEVGRRLNDSSLVSIANAWEKADRDLAQYVKDLIDDGIDLKDDPKPVAKKANTVGKQNSQVETIVNDVISKLPKESQHAVRMKVSKAENKLLTLQQELNRLGISL